MAGGGVNILGSAVGRARENQKPVNGKNKKNQDGASIQKQKNGYQRLYGKIQKRLEDREVQAEST